MITCDCQSSAALTLTRPQPSLLLVDARDEGVRRMMGRLSSFPSLFALPCHARQLKSEATGDESGPDWLFCFMFLSVAGSNSG